MVVHSVVVRALESYVAGSGFKVRWSHIFFIEIESLVKVRAASGISSEWLRIFDKPGK